LGCDLDCCSEKLGLVFLVDGSNDSSFSML
jgi:hypothetical protein